MFTMRPPSLSRLAAQDERTPDVSHHRRVEVLVAGFRDHAGATDGRVVDEDVQRPSDFLSLLEELASGIRFPEIGCHRMRPAAGGGDSRYYLAGSILVGRVTQHDLRAVG